MTPHLLAATLPDGLTFAIAGVIALVGSLGVVLSRNPVHSALMLIMSLFGVAVLFVEQDAQFLAAVQVIVYAGAIVVLFLFVIMLLGVDRSEAIATEPMPAQRLMAVGLGILALVEIALLSRERWPLGAHSVAGKARGTGHSNVYVLGRSLFTTYLLPFEVTSALLVIAVIGAIVLARRPRTSAGPTEGEAAAAEAGGGPLVDAGELVGSGAPSAERRVEAEEALARAGDRIGEPVGEQEGLTVVRRPEQ